MKIGFIRTFTGKHFSLQQPDPEQVDPRDLAHQLSMECRWGGAVARHYSVAEHSIYVARFAAAMVEPLHKDLAMAWGLLHDAHEAYLKDVPTPLKLLLGSTYTYMAAGIDLAVLRRFDLPPLPAEVIKAVKRADHHVAWCEADALLARCTGVEVSGDPPPAMLIEMAGDMRRAILLATIEQAWLSTLQHALKLIGGRW